MSDRICQFFLRGRCQRENCEFKHPEGGSSSSAAVVATKSAPNSGLSAGVCHFFARGKCKFMSSCRFRHEAPSGEANNKSKMAAPPAKGKKDDSDDESIMRKGGDSDDESIASGFTDAPPPPPAVVSAKKQDEPEPEKKTVGEVSSICKDTSTFIAATTDETMAKPSTPLLSRRAAGAKMNEAEKDKEIRRDSKGFENFEDYFDDSDANTTTQSNVDKSPEKQKGNDDVVDGQTVETPSKLNTKNLEENIQQPVRDSVEGSGKDKETQPPSDAIAPDAFTSVPAPTETMPEEILDEDTDKGDAAASSSKPVRRPPKKDEAIKKQVTAKKSSVADLSKDWDEEGDKDKEADLDSADKKAATRNNQSSGVKTNNASKKLEAGETPTRRSTRGRSNEETIEDIENFIRDDQAPEEEEPTSVAAQPPVAPKTEAGGEKSKKAKEEWVTVIFGEDGKQIEGEKQQQKKLQEKSVYDLNPEAEDLFIEEATPAYSQKPKVEVSYSRGRGKKTFVKKEGVTKIGNNTYFYTGDKEGNGEADEEEDEEEEEMEEGNVDEEGEGEYEEEEQEHWEAVPVADNGEGGEPKMMPKRRSSGRGYAQGRKKHKTNYVYGAKSTAAKTRRCGECEGCNREDCGKCPACLDKPKFGGRGAKKQACIYRICTWKNPSGKRITPQTPNLSDSAGGIQSGTIVSPAAVRRGRAAAAASSTSPGDSGALATSTPAVAAAAEASEEKAIIPESAVGRKRGRNPRQSIAVISPATGKAPDDSELPEFDPNKFKPGYTPPVVKKGDEEYVVVVTGVKDTGLCGKYWGDPSENLPKRRRCIGGTPEPVAKKGGTASPASSSSGGGGKRPHRSSTDSTETAEPEPAADSTTPPPVAKRGRPAKSKDPEPTPTPTTTTTANPEPDTSSTPTTSGSGKRGRGRPSKRPAAAAAAATVSEDSAEPMKAPAEPPAKKAQKETQEPQSSSNSKEDEDAASVMLVHSDFDKKKVTAAAQQEIAAATEQAELRKTPSRATKEAEAEAEENLNPVSSRTDANGVSGANRSVSCVADTNTQREVVVECFAPYDDHRWVNIGKERDGMSPDAVQYARALRPPYHLLSFLRIKGHSTKGMSCTDKNTMVFVVLEGEITVVLHTTQFNAKKGDSFYIPPKNYYNLINQKAREAELSLIQFQYDGPLPTVSAGSQSGTPKQSNAAA